MDNKLCLTELPSRCNFSALYGVEGILSNGLISLQPFDGYTGPVHAVEVENPNALNSFKIYAAAGEGGGPAVYVGDFQYQTPPDKIFYAFEDSFRGGVNIAVGDVNGDGVKDIVVGTGFGGGPRVKVYDGKSYNVIGDFYAAEESFRGGVNVAVSVGDIIVGTGPGGSPVIRRFSYGGVYRSGSYVGMADDRSGVQVSVQDTVPYDGTPEIVTLNNGTLRAFDTNYKPVGSIVSVDPQSSLGSGIYTNNLIPHVLIGTHDGHLQEWDLNPIFPEGRLVSDAEYLASTPLTVGESQQVYGVERYNQTGGYLSLLSNDIPLGAAFDPIPAAVAIGPLDGGTGSLTGYVQDASGTWYGLTNHHVVSDRQGNSFVGKEIRQPGPYFANNGRIFGTVKAFTQLNDGDNFVDSAIITVDPTKIDTRTAYVDGHNVLHYIQTGGLSTVHVGSIVYKFGFWGTRMGIVINDDATVKVMNEDGKISIFKHQLIAASAEAGVDFVIPGDSGSKITDAFGNVVGQLFAGGNGIGVFSAISTVYSSLGVH